jgi:hypothetical protein
MDFLVPGSGFFEPPESTIGEQGKNGKLFVMLSIGYSSFLSSIRVCCQENPTGAVA